MDIFNLEYLAFITFSFGILVSLSSASLFFMTSQVETQLRTVWRLVGFALLAVTFALFIVTRKWEIFGLTAYLFELASFIFIFMGVRSEPKLAQLIDATKVNKATKKSTSSSRIVSFINNNALLVIAVINVSIMTILVAYFINDQFSYLGVILAVVALGFITATLFFQIKRYRRDKSSKAVRLQNLYPLIGYIFLFFREITEIFSRVPDDISFVPLRIQTQEYSFSWVAGIVFAILGLGFLALWAWNFIKIRFQLRTLVTFLGVSIFISSLGALVFTNLIFISVENNNLELLQKSTRSQELVIEDRTRTALSLARSIAKDSKIVGAFTNNSLGILNTEVQEYIEISKIDTVRFYSPYGEIVASPTDGRDRGRIFASDPLIAFVMNKHQHIRSLDSEPGVLAPVLVARGLHPIEVDGEFVGVVEVGFRFDNAFVDFAKERTSLDVTLYVDDLRSATTITTLDEVSRWVGSAEVDEDVVQTTLVNGFSSTSKQDRLGRSYYSAFEPLSNFDGERVGMISSGKPTAILFEDTRQQLLTSFLILSILSLVVAYGGYSMMTSGSKVKTIKNEKGKKTAKK